MPLRSPDFEEVSTMQYKAGPCHNKRQKYHRGVNRIPWPFWSVCQHLLFIPPPAPSSSLLWSQRRLGGVFLAPAGGPRLPRPRLSTDAGRASGKLRTRQRLRDAFPLDHRRPHGKAILPRGPAPCPLAHTCGGHGSRNRPSQSRNVGDMYSTA